MTTTNQSQTIDHRPRATNHRPPSTDHLSWWNNLRHGGLLLDAPRLSELVKELPPPLWSYHQDLLRRHLTRFRDDPAANRTALITCVLESICGFTQSLGQWKRGTAVKVDYSRKALTGESIRPHHLWIGPHNSILPVFIDDQARLGIGRGRRVVSDTLQWQRQSNQSLALLTNGQEWRLLFAGLDYEAFCQWDTDAWFVEGQPSAELEGFRALVTPALWVPEKPGTTPKLLAGINDSRKGQADLSQVLGERVRQAAELLIQAHTNPLKDHLDTLDAVDIYRAAVRMIMRLVVILFAESREGLLARDNPVFHNTYSLGGLREQLERIHHYQLVNGVGAYPRILALQRLIYQGSSHPALPVPAYGGDLFAPGRPDAGDGMRRALHLFETACFHTDVMSDFTVRQILELLTRTKVKIRQGRTSFLVPAPVDFSRLDREYIGILYEGLLDFELRAAMDNQPIVFLAVGNQPALPLTTLESMDDKAIKHLLESMKDTSSASDDESSEKDEAESETQDADADSVDDSDDTDSEDGVDDLDELVSPPSLDPAGEAAQPIHELHGDYVAPRDKSDLQSRTPAPETSLRDPHLTLKSRAENWARRACEVGKLIPKLTGKITPERHFQYLQTLDRKARQLIVKVVLPGEWYLVRWGGTRKGSGTYYTRPQLAIPTVHRTLRPLAYDPPLLADGTPDIDAPTDQWTPKRPEEILQIKVCDPACGSGSFLLAALRFLTEALYRSLTFHDRIRQHDGRSILDLIYETDHQSPTTEHQPLASETLPCRPEDDEFEPRTKAILRRYIVERCLYGVDLDPLAVELCRLSLWIETLDRSLPLTFLNHKIKCGNSLVGAWFDQFLHYPIMAWEREGGDKTHTNGVHFAKEAWTKSLKEFKSTAKADLIRFIDGGRFASMYSVDLSTVKTVHDHAEQALREIHSLGIAQVDQRAERYEALLASDEFQGLKFAFDLWCTLWFWPADQLHHAPLPTDFASGDLSDEARQVVRHVADKQRFFHWELEFPDVFNAHSSGFHAILGNPPWETLQPNSKEYFSAFDPMYRTYGKQEALKKQTDYFTDDASTERSWLEFNSFFKCFANWYKAAGAPFGDQVTVDSQKRESHAINLGDRRRNGFASSERRHQRWKAKREESTGYADAQHCFLHQGSGKPYTYKMFVELSHALLRADGRFGLVIPSGLYSDYGAIDLRKLLIDQCSWEWLFGFENRDKVFDIDSRFKFNPVIVAKGGQTQAIRTAFMRRQLSDWERAESFATRYSREQVVQFSPHSRAILEIQSQRDLEVLTKIYANSVLLGDQSENGWGIKYAQGDFNMTSDSKLFPPRPLWEEWGYRPDEYSRWIKGPWKPIAQLWHERDIDPTQPVPLDPACAQRVRDAIASGEAYCTVQTTTDQEPSTTDPSADHRPPTTFHRLAQPPYNTLPIPRADIPEGIILSREATHYIKEDEIPTVTFTEASGKPLRTKVLNDKGEPIEVDVTGAAIALPLYEGRMIGQFDFSEKGWVSGKGRGSIWREIEWNGKHLEPQFLMSNSIFPQYDFGRISKIGQMRVTSGTNTRTLITTPVSNLPCGDKVATLNRLPLQGCLSLSLVLNSFSCDYQTRQRIAALQVDQHILFAIAVPPPIRFPPTFIPRLAAGLAVPACSFSVTWLTLFGPLKTCYQKLWCLTDSQRASQIVMANAISAILYGHDTVDISHLLKDCDWPTIFLESGAYRQTLFMKGFWRVNKQRAPEHRLTVLSLVAFHDLQAKIAECGGDVEKGIEAFCNQNDGEGWMLPETLRLADYGLGHDDRAQEHQPVRSFFGPRFYDWQLAQTAEESWRECHLHARNLLGPAGYQELLEEIRTGQPRQPKAPPTASPTRLPDQPGKRQQGKLFETEHLPLFDREDP